MRSTRAPWLIVLLMLAVSADSHLLNMSRATVTLEPLATVAVTLELDILTTVGDRQAYYELSQTPDPMSDPSVLRLLSSLPDAVEIHFGDRRIPLSLTSIRFPTEEQSVFLDPLRWPRTVVTLSGQYQQDDVESSTGLQVRFNETFFFEEPIATTVLEVESGRTQTRWLVTGQRSPIFDAASWLGRPSRVEPEQGSGLASILDYLRAGIRHILPGGFDHLMFVAGLVLAAHGRRQLVITVSLFTLAHSVTLIFGALGWLKVSPWLVEPLILVSILWIGVANIRRTDTARFDRLIVFGFGLLHGLGFAGALRELSLPGGAVIPPLLAFNVGVEIGQLTFIGVALVLYRLWARRWNSATAVFPIADIVRQTVGWGIVVLSAGLLIPLLYAL